MTLITWLQGGSNPDNGKNFEIIRDWWNNLSGKEVIISQRLIPDDGDASRINWEPQKFDDQLVMFKSEMRGITLYWQKSFSEDERNFTPSKLELDQIQENLYIYPQSQPKVIIRVGIPNIRYTTLSMKEPELSISESGGDRILLMRDRDRQIAVQLPLTPTTLKRLQELF
ncbi:hypothetical protein FRE64_14470 [Euhalothece natronophila Z-M001]|uniref:Uncharacterized protein n=1 Tax=Euhalothece natronophila Z-M001 TaxID=522448 RepID=A0A5B8NPT1_9CHRO|nr:hypothetical protein [Euhalothece natronophila]QDZ41038.1 hypothetical protein FRE64_14470 [Euhalothece natronophila Z-M001]